MSSDASTRDVFLPKLYFVTSGEGLSTISVLNAFDNALQSAGVDACNLVYTSSIIPKDAVKVKQTKITPGMITFSVVARMDGNEGEVIGAGIGYGMCEKKGKPTYGFVAENHGYKDSQIIKDELMIRLEKMASSRGFKLVDPKIAAQCMHVPKDRYGCCVVAFVFLPNNLC